MFCDPPPLLLSVSDSVELLAAALVSALKSNALPCTLIVTSAQLDRSD